MGIIIDGESVDDVRIEKLEALKAIDDKYMQLLRANEAAKLEAEVFISPELMEAVKELAERIGEVGAELAEAFKDFLAENMASLEIAEKLEEYAKYYREERFDLTREEWREAEAFASQKAAARARSYAGALTMEKAREVRRRRKWRKRIDDRVHTVRSF